MSLLRIPKLKNFISFLCLALGDILALMLALYFAYWFRMIIIRSDLFNQVIRFIYPDYTYVYFPFTYLLTFWWLGGILVLILGMNNLYINSRLPFWAETRLIVRSVFIAVTFYLIIIFVGKFTSRTSSLAILFLYFSGSIFIPITRLIVKNILYKIGIWKESVVIVGTNALGQEAAQGILEEKFMGYVLEGFLDETDSSVKEIKIQNKSYPILGKPENFNELIQKNETLTFIVALKPNSRKQQKIIKDIQTKVKRFFVIPEANGIALLNTKLIYLFMQEIFLLRVINNMNNFTNHVIKRVFDLLLAFVLLPVMIPIFIVIAILIKIESKGPVLYPHQRVGKNGKIINVFKFRSMYSDAKERLEKLLDSDPELKKEWEIYFKLKDDPRVTRIGKILRKFSLDELPQLFNVIQGSMSFIGPRPVIKEELEKYYKDSKDYYFSAKPGISGLWQVSGRNDVDYKKRVALDTWYILNWSFWLDIIILVKTFKAVFKKEGAY